MERAARVRRPGTRSSPCRWHSRRRHALPPRGGLPVPRGRTLRPHRRERGGKGSTWTSAARYLKQSQSISDEDARRIRWLDTFGQLTGNTDRHFGNLSFFEDGPKRFKLAPAYDMLPMMFAPVGTTIVERAFEPRPPTSETLDVWSDAARHALAYWTRLLEAQELGQAFRARCAQCRDSLAALIQRTPV